MRTGSCSAIHHLRINQPLHLSLLSGFRKVLLADARRGDNAPNTREGDGINTLVSALADPAIFSWALECVLSRAFQLPPRSAAALVIEEGCDVPVKAPEVTPPAPDETRMALLPLIDSINHYSRMPTHMYWEADGALSLSGGARWTDLHGVLSGKGVCC